MVMPMVTMMDATVMGMGMDMYKSVLHRSKYTVYGKSIQTYCGCL